MFTDVHYEYENVDWSTGDQFGLMNHSKTSELYVLAPQQQAARYQVSTTKILILSIYILLSLMYSLFKGKLLHKEI